MCLRIALIGTLSFGLSTIEGVLSADGTTFSVDEFSLVVVESLTKASGIQPYHCISWTIFRYCIQCFLVNIIGLFILLVITSSGLPVGQTIIVSLCYNTLILPVDLSRKFLHQIFLSYLTMGPHITL